MGEFSENDMPEPDVSADIPDVEAAADVVAESPADTEPVSDIVDESPSDTEPATEIVQESPDVSEPNQDSAFESEPSTDLPLELESSADTLPMIEPDANPESQMEPDFTLESSPETQFEPSPEIPFESDPFSESLPESAPELVPETPSEQEDTFESIPESHLEPSPDVPFESELSAESLPETAPEMTPEIPLEQETSLENVTEAEPEQSPDVPFELEPPHEMISEFPADATSTEPLESSPEIPQELEPSPQPYGEPRYYEGSPEELPFIGPEQTELYHSPETMKEIEPGTGPNPSWDQPPDGSLNDTYDGMTVGEEGWMPLEETSQDESLSSEDSELSLNGTDEQSINLMSDAAVEAPDAEAIPPDIVDTQPVTEQTGLEEEAMPEQSTGSTPGDTDGQAQQEETPKLYFEGEELTLPGDGEREYRIGSPHQDFEDYKKIADAERQHELGVAAQTSDSFGEAVGTLVEAQQGGTDFTEADNYMYEKYGHDPYTDAAYPQSENSLSSQSGSVDNLQSSVNEETDVPTDLPVPLMPAETTSFKDSQERNISLRRWGDEGLIQIRAYDTNLGDVPENPNIGTAGMTNLKVEAGIDGSTQVRLQDIVVPPDYRNSGIAGNMLDQTLEIAKAKGASEVYGVIENEAALDYWKHMEEKETGWKVDPGQGAYGYVRYDMSSAGGKKK